MNHLKHYNRWADLPHDGKKAARRPYYWQRQLVDRPLPCVRSRNRTKLPSRRRPT